MYLYLLVCHFWALFYFFNQFRSCSELWILNLGFFVRIYYLGFCYLGELLSGVVLVFWNFDVWSLILGFFKQFITWVFWEFGCLAHHSWVIWENLVLGVLLYFWDFDVWLLILVLSWELLSGVVLVLEEVWGFWCLGICCYKDKGVFFSCLSEKMAADGALSFSVTSVVEDVLQQHGNNSQSRSRNLDLDARKAEEAGKFCSWFL